MTKEEAIRATVSPTYIAIYEPVLVDIPFHEVYKPMDVFAKQQTLTFFKWVKEDKNEWTESDGRPGYWYPAADGIELAYYSLPGLYDQFIEQQNKP